MNRRQILSGLGLACISAMPLGAFAQSEDRPKNRGGGGGPGAGTFQVLAIDPDARTLRLRGADGRESTVKVPEGVYELRKLNVGDRIQVNFTVPDAMNPGLRAAGIWPAN